MVEQDQIEYLLSLVPEHQRTSCSDESPTNGYTTSGRGGAPRCTRCALLKAQKSEDFASNLTSKVIVNVSVWLPSKD